MKGIYFTPRSWGIPGYGQILPCLYYDFRADSDRRWQVYCFGCEYMGDSFKAALSVTIRKFCFHLKHLWRMAREQAKSV